MFVAALIVFIVAVLLVIAALFGGDDHDRHRHGWLRPRGPASLVFFLGMGTLLLFVLSLGMFRSGAKRAAARRADKKRVSELSNKLDAYKREERERAATPLATTPDGAPMSAESSGAPTSRRSACLRVGLSPVRASRAEELGLAARNHALPAEALRWEITPPGLHYVLTHYDIPEADPTSWSDRGHRAGGPRAAPESR